MEISQDNLVDSADINLLVAVPIGEGLEGKLLTIYLTSSLAE